MKSFAEGSKLATLKTPFGLLTVCVHSSDTAVQPAGSGSLATFNSADVLKEIPLGESDLKTIRDFLIEYMGSGFDPRR